MTNQHSLCFVISRTFRFVEQDCPLMYSVAVKFINILEALYTNFRLSEIILPHFSIILTKQWGFVCVV